MIITLQRNPSIGGATVGKLYIAGNFACHTLEDEVREIAGQPVAHWKIHGQTAIPSGEYIVSLQDSARFGPDTLTINNVPGFEYIRMHAGNTSQDTEGCILLGMRAAECTLVGGTSRPAVELVRGDVRAAIDRGEVVHIVISNATEVA